MTNHPKSLSQSEFARQVGVSPRLICRMLADGRLPSAPNRQVQMPEALQAWHDYQQSRQEDDQIRSSTGTKTAEMKLRLLAARARLVELEWQRQRGELVAIADVQADARAACEVIRAQLLTLGSRVAMQVAGEGRPAVCQALIDEEVNMILTVLHNTRFASDEQVEDEDGAADIAADERE